MSDQEDINCRLELDTHADTCTFGGHGCLQIEAGPSVSLNDYDGRPTGDTADVSTVAVAYDCQDTHHTYVLFYHQALHSSKLSNHLVNPFQMREAGMLVNDTAPHLCTVLSSSTVLLQPE